MPISPAHRKIRSRQHHGAQNPVQRDPNTLADRKPSLVNHIGTSLSPILVERPVREEGFYSASMRPHAIREEALLMPGLPTTITVKFKPFLTFFRRNADA